MYIGYNITFKLIDRGVLEAVGSTGVSYNLQRMYFSFRSFFETGSLYSYITIQLLLVITFLFIIL